LTGFAEYLPGDYGDGLATFADADFARCLCSRRSVSASFHLLNGVIVSWSCKKQPITTLHSSGAELTSLHRAGFKVLCYNHSFPPLENLSKHLLFFLRIIRERLS
jgi:hypothetical protein